MTTSLEFTAKGGRVHVTRRTFIVDVDRDRIHEMGAMEAEGCAAQLGKAIAEAHRQDAALRQTRLDQITTKIASLEAEKASLQDEEQRHLRAQAAALGDSTR